MADVLVKALGPPRVVGQALAGVEDVVAACVYGSWAAGASGVDGGHPVADIDVLVLGDPDRDEVYAAVAPAEDRLGRPIQVTIRPADWLEHGRGSFHAMVTARPMIAIPLTPSSRAEVD